MMCGSASLIYKCSYPLNWYGIVLFKNLNYYDIFLICKKSPKAGHIFLFCNNEATSPINHLLPWLTALPPSWNLMNPNHLKLDIISYGQT